MKDQAQYRQDEQAMFGDRLAPLPRMDDYTAVGLAEGFIEAESQEQVIEAWQTLIDRGLAFRLQGFFGRTAMRLIDQGICRAAA